jgi:spore germination protein KA
MTFNKRKKPFRSKRNQNGSEKETVAQSEVLSFFLYENIERIKKLVGNSPDFIIRTFESGIVNRLEMAIVYVSGLVDVNLVNDDILKPLMKPGEGESRQSQTTSELLTVIKNRILAVSNTKRMEKMDEMISSLLSGYTVILANGLNQGIAAQSTGGERRGVEEPGSQSVIRGPRDGFAEDLNINTSILRRRIKSP